MVMTADKIAHQKPGAFGRDSAVAPPVMPPIRNSQPRKIATARLAITGIENRADAEQDQHDSFDQEYPPVGAYAARQDYAFDGIGDLHHERLCWAR